MKALRAAGKFAGIAGGLVVLASVCYCNYFVYSKAIDLMYIGDNRREYSADMGSYDVRIMKKRETAAFEYGLALLAASPILLSLGTLAGKALGELAASPFASAEKKLGKLEEKLNERNKK